MTNSQATKLTQPLVLDETWHTLLILWFLLLQSLDAPEPAESSEINAQWFMGN